MKNKKGITLIALIVTIIVLLILAGVSLNLVAGGNGIIGRTTNAVEQYNASVTNETEELTSVESMLDDYMAGGMASIEAGETARGGNKQYTDINDVTITIPKGFTVSGISTEQTVENGLVIYDLEGADTSTWDVTYWTTNKDTIQESYNQFVWVPVDSTKFTRNDWKNWDGTNEPTLLSTTTLTSGEYSESASTDPTGKYTEMVNSVKSNGGFYIARYEAGTTADSGTGIRGTVVSKKNANVYNNIGWSSVNDMTTTTGGALEVASGMYPKSILIYGVQWDAVMRWLSDDNGLKQYVTNSIGKGNYQDEDNTNNPGRTGIFEMKNIYDMAGNVWEWTMEAYGVNGRIPRGGVYSNTGSDHPISERGFNYPGYSGDIIGFRPALYL